MAQDGSAERFLLRRGNYRALLSFRKVEIVYDLTRVFCRRFLQRGDRTIDQMVQAARSGKQNLVEGSRAAKTSTEMEIKLTNVARASLDELLNHYGDYLRAHSAPIWDRDLREVIYVRRLGRDPELTFERIRGGAETRPGQVVANIALCFIHQADFLIDRLLLRLEQDFLKEGGLRERMMQARVRSRRSRKT